LAPAAQTVHEGVEHNRELFHPARNVQRFEQLLPQLRIRQDGGGDAIRQNPR